MQEIFKDIFGYEGRYQISNLGNIKSLDIFIYNKNKKTKNIKKGRILKKRINDFGYEQIQLLNKKNIYSVHRLVAQAFIPNLLNKPHVNHINSIRNDNRLENLEWCTASENQLHSYNTTKRRSPNLGKILEKSHLSKKVNQYDLQGNFIKTWDCIKKIELEIGVSADCIGMCCNNRPHRKTSGGFIWKYK